jgi:histidinol-phosphate aminotransferase
MPDTPLAQRLARTLRQDVQSMHAYAIQDSRGLIKLDAMENPFSLPPELQQALGERLGRAPIHRYPATVSAELGERLGAHFGVPAGCRVMLGNGSDELIDLLSVACDVPGATILAPVPGFVMYAVSAQLRGLRFVGVPLTSSYELDEAAMLAAIERVRPAITYLANPNNPTGNLWDESVMLRLIDAVGRQDGLVVIDEAYQPFSSRSFMPQLAKWPHVLVMRTLSKFGLAGVRLGYLSGHIAVINEIDKVRPPYNVSVLNAEATHFALDHAGLFAEQAQIIKAQRTRLIQALSDMAGVEVFPSEANMILIRVPNAAAVFQGMKQRGVLVKNVSGLHGLLRGCLRLTVGTPDENSLMLAALSAALQEMESAL